jgi:hypothetical protein
MFTTKASEVYLRDRTIHHENSTDANLP